MKTRNNKVEIKLISPKAEEALNKLVEKGYIEFIGFKKAPTYVALKPSDDKPKVPLNFAKSSNEEILKRMNLKQYRSNTLAQARKIIDSTRKNNSGKQD